MAKPHSNVNTNYFVCTLGEATELKQGESPQYSTVSHLIDQQANTNPDLPAVAFPLPGSGLSPWESQIYTFKEVRDGSIAFANSFRDKLQHHSSSTIALLCPSSVDFFFAWLALMRAGHSVLIIAPQCTPTGIAHLCHSCNAATLFHDKAYRDLARSASKVAAFGLHCRLLPWQGQDLSIRDAIAGATKLTFDCANVLTTQVVAFFFHTSGTSTGLPKPIPQIHHAAVGILPSLCGEHHATFTTTPLYHGGIADYLRSWTSSALIWLFPGADIPITTNSILSCISCADRTTKQGLARISYFASVPYILQMLAEESSGLDMLREMSLVSVGGAALPQIIGDKLVQKGVNLVSRFGSACKAGDIGDQATSDDQYRLLSNDAELGL